ncbi:MAG: Ig-like domain-containing protein [Eubacteriales bacterium]|nr:Ig-like domain-containing protein [Christensenellaceae bacterium]MEA5065583.1 Ig-like domain-containing protein [Eubacteriales bacterium]
MGGKWMGVLMALLLAFVTPAARAEGPAPDPILVESVALSTLGEAHVRVGETLQILSEVLPTDAADRALNWSVDDETLATVDGAGLVTGVKPGKVTVRAVARDGGGAAGALEVEVRPVLVERIELSLAQKALCYNARWPIEARLTPENATDTALVWTSGDESIVEIVEDEGGNRFLKAGDKAGRAVIAATAADGGGAQALCEVEVAAPVEEILIDMRGVESILRGEQIEFTADVLPSEASGELRWESGDPSVATIERTDEGVRLVGVGGGEVALIARAQDGSGREGRARIMVRVPVEEVRLPETCGVFLGRQRPLTAELLPADTTDRLVRFESRDPAVAAVDERGQVRGVSVGVAEVVARSAADPDVWDVCDVVVTAPVTAIVLDAEDAEVGVGGSMWVVATVSPADAGNRGVRFESSDPSVLRVNDWGVVTGVSAGEAVVQAIALDGSGVMGAMAVAVREKLSSIALPGTAALLPEEWMQLTLVTRPIGLNPGAIEWKSGDEAVVTVVGDGWVRGVAPGEAVVTATAENGLVARCRVKVSHRLSAIELSDERGALAAEPYEIDRGQTKALRAAAQPAGIPVEFAWTSSDARVASVTREGALYARKPGAVTVTVTARALDGGQKVSRRLKVRVIESVSKVVLPERIDVLAGRGVRVSAKLEPRQATHRGIAWATGNQAVATVDEKGAVRGVAPGETVLTATSHNRLVGLSRVVVSRAVQSVALTAVPARPSLSPGDQMTLQVAVLPAEAGQGVSFASSNARVAKVSAEGVVTARKPGTARITATARDGSGAKALLTVRVLAAVDALKLDRRELTLYVNGSGAAAPATARLKAKLTPKTAAKHAVAWSSSEPDVATVDEHGVVTARRDGLAIIVASTENGRSDRAAVWIKTLPTQVALAREQIVLAARTAFDLREGLEMDGTEDALRWTSSRPAVAKVSKEGVVRAGAKPGRTTVTATTKNGLKASCIVEVTAQQATPAPTGEPTPGPTGEPTPGPTGEPAAEPTTEPTGDPTP